MIGLGLGVSSRIPTIRLPRAGLLFDIPNRYPFVDRVGANTRTLYGLQYLHLSWATDFTNASIIGTETVTSQPAGTAAITVAAGKLTIGAGDLWSWAVDFGGDDNISTYEFGTILTSTTGVVFDTSGHGRHLLFTVANTASVCLSGYEEGSDTLNIHGVVRHTQNGDEVALPIFPSFRNSFGGKLAPLIKPWGDSLTAGMAPKLRNIYRCIYTTGGVGGQTSTQIRDRFLESQLKGDIAVLWPGNNNPTPPSTVISHVNEMIAALLHDKYLVCSLLVNAVHAIDSSTYTSVMNYNAQQSATHGVRYVDLLGELIANYDPENPQDLLDVAKGITPSSLRTDDIHLNATGYEIVAAKILSVVKNLGWLDGAIDYITPGVLSSPALQIGPSSELRIYKNGVGVDLTSAYLSNREGTSSLDVVAGTNRISVSGGTIYNFYITLNTGEIIHFPFCEGSGATAFGYSQGAECICTIHSPTAPTWPNQNTYIHSMIHGSGRINEGVLLPERILPLEDSDFSADTASWARTGTWTISEGMARHTGTTGHTMGKSALCSGATFLCEWDVAEYGGSGLIGLSGGTVSGGYYQNSTGHKSKKLVSVSNGLTFYSTSDCAIDNVSVREKTTNTLTIGGNPYTGLDAFGGILSFKYSINRAKYNIIPISNPDDTTLNPTHTYSLADSHQVRDALGWTWGGDHWAFTSTGIPKEILGSVLIANGGGDQFFCGSKRIAGYSTVQVEPALTKIKRLTGVA